VRIIGQYVAHRINSSYISRIHRIRPIPHFPPYPSIRPCLTHFQMSGLQQDGGVLKQILGLDRQANFDPAL